MKRRAANTLPRKKKTAIEINTTPTEEKTLATTSRIQRRIIPSVVQYEKQKRVITKAINKKEGIILMPSFYPFSVERGALHHKKIPYYTYALEEKKNCEGSD